MHGDKECPFNGVTNYGRVWRKVPEREGWSSVRRIFCSLHSKFVRRHVYAIAIATQRNVCQQNATINWSDD